MSSVEKRAASKASHSKAKKAPVRAAARKAAAAAEIVKSVQALRKEMKEIKEQQVKISTGQAELRGRLRKLDEAVEGEEQAAPSPVERKREAVRRYRVEMKRQGMKLAQFWVPDVNAPGFAEECRRQSLLAAGHPGESDVMVDLEANQAHALSGEPDFDWGEKGPPK
jgi:hypothetical protein